MNIISNVKTLISMLTYDLMVSLKLMFAPKCVFVLQFYLSSLSVSQISKW